MFVAPALCHQFLLTGRAVIIDCRPLAEYSKGRILGAYHYEYAPTKDELADKILILTAGNNQYNPNIMDKIAKEYAPLPIYFLRGGNQAWRDKDYGWGDTPAMPAKFSMAHIYYGIMIMASLLLLYAGQTYSLVGGIAVMLAMVIYIIYKYVGKKLFNKK